MENSKFFLTGSQDVTTGYKKAATKVLIELEKTLGKDLEDQEKFMFVHGTAECKLPEPEEDFSKSVKRCIDARDQSEKAIEAENWKDALRLLNLAVSFAPTQESEDLSLLAFALFKRSEVLLILKEYDLALRDATLAGIKGAFPETSLYQLYKHQAKCQEACKSPFEAQKCYNRAISALDKSDLNASKKDTQKINIQDALNLLGKRIETKNMKGKKDDLEILKKHPKYPALSRSVSVQYSQERGRYVSAGDDIKIGDVLGVEEPITFSLKQDQLKSRCLNCFISVCAGLPCQTCSQVVFCGLACRRQATTTFHRHECQNMHLLKHGPNYLALRAITKKSVQYFLDKRLDTFANYDDSGGTELEGSKSYKSLEMRNLFNLTIKKADLEKKMEFFMIAVYLLKILQKMGYFETEKENESTLTEEEVYIGMLLAHFLAVIECNSHLICHLSKEHFNITTLPDILKKNFQPEEIGCGINTTLAFFNHSCNPNTIKIQKGNKTSLVATENIKKGEEIFDNYGYIFYSSDKISRNEEMGFECKCEPCSQDWPKYRKLSDKISVAENASPHVAAGSLERGRAANSLMQKMSLELRLAHFSRVISLSGDYKRTLDKIIAPPHRFFFNNYMIFFYSHWVKYGNRDLTE